MDTVGSANGFFGPYTMNVDCFSGLFTTTDSFNLEAIQRITVGANPLAAFSFLNPAIDAHLSGALFSYCVIT